MLVLIALLLAQAVPPTSVRVTNSNGTLSASVTAAGAGGTNALGVQGVSGGVPMPITGSISVTGTGDTPTAAVTFNANNQCTNTLLTAGEQSAGFQLNTGTLDATLTAYGIGTTAAINCATSGTCTALTTSAGGTIVVTNPNATVNYNINVIGGLRQVMVCTTTYNSGSATGFTVATFLQAASSGGGGGGTVTQGNAGSNAQAWWVRIGDTTNGPAAVKAASTAAGATDKALVVAVSPNNTVAVTQSGSWTVAATQSGTWNITNVSGTVSLPTGAATAAKQPALGTAGAASSDVLTIQGVASMTPVAVSQSGAWTVAATQSGTWNITNISGTVSLPTGASTSAKQPALGTAGTASTDVITVQGIASMTPFQSAQSGSWTVAATQSGTWNLTNISGTISLPTGAATDATVAALEVAQGSTTSGQNGILAQCAVTTAAPTYTTAKTAPCSVDTAGNLRITGSISATNPSVSATAGAVPASATYIGANQAGNLVGLLLDGSGFLKVNVAAGGASGGTSSSFAAAFPATGTAVGASDGTNMQPLLVDGSGNLKVLAAQTGSWTVAATQSGAWNIGTVTTVSTVTAVTSITNTVTIAGDVASGSSNSGNPLQAGGRAASTVTTAVTDGQRVSMQMDLHGRVVTTPGGDRALITQNTVTLTASTSETTLLSAGGSGVFLDLMMLSCTNTASSSNVITVRDATAGTMRLTISCPAQVGPCEGWVWQAPFKQTTANNNWTIQAGTSATSVICSAQSVQTK